MTPKEGSLATDHTWSRPSNLRHTLHIGIPDMVQVGQKQPARLGHSGGCTPPLDPARELASGSQHIADRYAQLIRITARRARCGSCGGTGSHCGMSCSSTRRFHRSRLPSRGMLCASMRPPRTGSVRQCVGVLGDPGSAVAEADGKRMWTRRQKEV
jgi:hypothetical protein